MVQHLVGLWVQHEICGFPKIRGTLLGVPRLRTVVYWGRPILGNHHVDAACVRGICSPEYGPFLWDSIGSGQHPIYDSDWWAIRSQSLHRLSTQFFSAPLRRGKYQIGGRKWECLAIIKSPCTTK